MSGELRVLAIGGVDPCAGAGITADACTIAALGARPATVPACLTVQSRRGFAALEAVAPELLGRMLRAVLEDGPLHAVKTGLLGSAATVAVVADVLAPVCGEGRVPLVVDPVLEATAGGYRAAGELVAAYRERLLPLARVATPNTQELERLAAGAPALLAAGAGAVLVTDGAGAGDVVRDRLFTRDGGCRVFAAERLAVGAVHGTGCALSAAFAVRLAAGAELGAACGAAIAHVRERLARLGPAVNALPRPLPLPVPQEG